MDKATYLKLKQERLEVQNNHKHPKEEYCYSCWRLQKNCLCEYISPFDTNFHFVILIHPMEAKKEKMGTGKISKSCLKNSSMIMGVDFTEDAEVNALIEDPKNHCMVMYPGATAINVSEHDVQPLVEKTNAGKRLVVFLIDGTWPCAKKMMRQSFNLQKLPRISFTATHTSIFEIKEQPADYCLSTLESIQFFIKECNRKGLENTDSKEDHMLEVFKAMISFQKKCAEDPALSSYRNRKRGYSKKEDRVRAKKWLVRNIVLAD
jgi:DTW domain-containing protein YfiP